MGRKPLTESEDPKVQARREKAREYYAKKKSQTVAGSMTSSFGSFKPEPKMPMSNLKTVAEAKSTLAGAIRSRKAKQVLETKKEQKKFRSEGENDLSVYAELPRDEIYLYASQYPRVVNFLKNTINKNNSHILFTYKPYYDYDSFVYTYRSANGKFNTYTFKINNDADIDYSSYLYDTFYEPAFEKHNKKAKPLDKLPLNPPIGIPPPPLQYSNDVLVTNREHEEDKTPKSSSGSRSRSSTSSGGSSGSRSSTSSGGSSGSRSSTSSSGSSGSRSSTSSSGWQYGSIPSPRTFKI
jgi:uncharacterized membrane protein YgcG